MRPLRLFPLLVLLAACDAGTTRALYADDEIDYFVEVALGSEFGGGSAAVRRWERDVRIAVRGAPTEADRQTLEAVVADANALVGPVRLVLVDESPTVTVHFLPPDEFAAVEPNYVPGNLGFFWTWWSGGCEITRARILISTEDVTQAERSHLIREELTQSLGLMRDSDRYPESVFYAPWTDVTEYAPIDRVLVEMLYRPEIEPCMGAAEARRALEAITE